jgi:hypothetical protein
MKKILLCIIVCSLSVTSYAQRKTKEKIKPQKTLNVKMSLRGNPNNIGFLIGAEKMFKQKRVTIKGKSDKSCFRNKQNFVTLNANFNSHPTFRNNVMFSVEWIKRTTFKDKLFIEGSIGLGVGKGFSQGQKTYVKQPDGSVKTKKQDNTYPYINFMYGGGYNFEKKYFLPIKLYAKGGLSGIYYHKFPYLSYIGEVGVIANVDIFKRR